MPASDFKPDILVVEDDREIDEFLNKFYGKEPGGLGHRVLLATNAEKAVRATDQNRGRPTVALVDLGLPGQMDGIQFLAHLSKYCPHVAAYVITGSGNKDLHRQAKWAGAIEVFVKPLDSDDLCRAVQSPVVERLVTSSLNDFLTGLQFRWVFEDVANGHILSARRNCEVLSLLFVDINDFKMINDTLDHDAGDKVLRQVATIIRENLRVYDHPCRWGGDEIAVLLPAIERRRALRIAESLRRAVSKEVFKIREGVEITLSISVGVTSLGTKDKNVRDMVRRADRSMYTDKKRQKKERAA